MVEVKKLLVVCFVACVLPNISCEAESNSTDQNAEKNTDAKNTDTKDTVGSKVGRFQVGGIIYKTTSSTGITDKEGTFYYENGETIEFSLGELYLGKSIAKPIVTMFDIANVSQPPVGNIAINAATKNSNFRRLVNMSVLLASFDDNGDISDGVHVTPTVASLFDGTLGFDFENSLNKFSKGNLRAVFFKAQDLFSVPHKLVRPPHVMQVLYQSIALDAEVYGLVKQSCGRGGGVSRDLEISFDTFGYPNQDVLDEKLIYNNDGDLLSNSYREHEYSAVHHLIKTTVTPANGDINIHNQLITYNPAGKPIKIERGETDVAGNFVGNTVNWQKFDEENGSLLSSSIYSSEGVLIREVNYTYSTSHTDRLIMDVLIAKTPEKDIEYRTDLIYNKNNLTKSLSYKEGNLVRETHYNTDKKIVRIEDISDKKEVRTYLYEDGNMIEYIYTNKDNQETQSYEYNDGFAIKSVLKVGDIVTTQCELYRTPTGWGVLGKDLDVTPKHSLYTTSYY